MAISDLPHLNAALNGIAGLLLCFGFYQIKSGNQVWHKKAMIAATLVSAAFLTSYLIYHANAPIFRFNGAGLAKYFYYTVLISHVILAAACVPMILWTVSQGLLDHRKQHKRIARWTAPVWMYVSATGIIVYVMLYHFNPPSVAG